MRTERRALAEFPSMVQPAAPGAAPRTRREARALLRSGPAPSPSPSPSESLWTAAGLTPAPPLRRPRDRGARPRVAFRPDVEGLRAVAVVLVVLFHARLAPLPGGFVGVDVFFVISGFLITSLLVDEVRTTGSISLADFYARRARRLLPAAFVVLIATVLAAAALLPALDGPAVAADVRAAALFVANWHFALQETDYFSSGGRSLVVHFWSLSLEEQFYLAWPVLVLLVAGHRRAARRAARPAPRATDRRLWAILAPVGIVSFALSATTTASAGPWAYFGTHTRAWELAAGAAVALSRPHLHRLTDLQSSVLGWAGLAAVIGAAVRLDDSMPVPGVVLVVPVAGAAAIVAAGARSQRGVAALLGHRPLALLGRLSYSLYLWHWVCLEITRRVWAPPAVDDLPQPDAPAVARLLAVLVSLGLAVVTFRYVEEPARAARLLRPVRRALPAAGVLVAGAVAASVLVLPSPPPLPATPEASDAAVLSETAPSSPSPSASRTRRPSPAPAPSAPARPPLAPVLRMTPAAARADQAPTRDCFAGFGPTTAPAGCRFGDPAGSKVVVLFGDSHAAHWFPALDAAARRQHWQLWFWAKSGCGYADVREWLASYRREYSECSAWRRSALGRIAAMPRVDLVVVGRAISYLGQVLDGGDVLDRTAAAPVWAAGAERTFDGLATGGRPVLLLRDVPRPGFDVPACLSAHDDGAACTFPQAGHLHPDEQLWAAEQSVVKRLGVQVGDLSPVVCPADPCGVVSPNGAILYRDEHHLTATFARESAPAVLAVLRRYLS
jgi:peptidoglycan/LPS O-acetylase OafA/YrhL